MNDAGRHTVANTPALGHLSWGSCSSSHSSRFDKSNTHAQLIGTHYQISEWY